MIVNYLVNPKIKWVIDGIASDRTAQGTWEDWTFTIAMSKRGGWDVKANGVQAWTHMRGFNDAMDSVAHRLREWAYLDQFKVR